MDLPVSTACWSTATVANMTNPAGKLMMLDNRTREQIPGQLHIMHQLLCTAYRKHNKITFSECPVETIQREASSFCRFSKKHLRCSRRNVPTVWMLDVNYVL